MSATWRKGEDKIKVDPNKSHRVVVGRLFEYDVHFPENTPAPPPYSRKKNPSALTAEDRATPVRTVFVTKDKPLRATE